MFTILLSINLLLAQPDSVKTKPVFTKCQVKETNTKLDSILIKLQKIKQKKNEQQISKTRKK